MQVVKPLMYKNHINYQLWVSVGVINQIIKNVRQLN